MEQPRRSERGGLTPHRGERVLKHERGFGNIGGINVINPNLDEKLAELLVDLPQKVLSEVA